ncbi:MAG: hypothetical protein J5992_08715 [Oscillospiraceae bacterium]|nr:hypothetical protein [Oscillospiraceae bacterium]
MEFLILLIVIIVFCLCLGLGPIEIFIGFSMIFLLLVLLTALFFLYNIFRIVLSKRVKATFTKVDASPKSRFTVAYYKSCDEEYPCIFPNEPLLRKILYKEGKEITVLFDKKHRRVYDRYSIITCFVGLVFTVLTVAGAVFFVVSNGITLG